MSTELPDGLTWVKATASNDKGACVEVAKLPDGGAIVKTCG
jgi:hypothetical protein